VEEYANGDRYEGEFVEDKPEGPGTLTKKSGEVIQGTWVVSRLARFQPLWRIASLTRELLTGPDIGRAALRCRHAHHAARISHP
jgi:hypothetical protein